MPESLQKDLKKQESLHNSDIGDYLEKNGEILIAPLGVSMLPLLRGDSCQVVLKTAEDPPKPYDVVLYRAESRKLILHRVICRDAAGYRIRGDNTYSDETGIREEQILGVMTGFYRKNRFTSCEDRGYRIYSRIWVGIYPVRRFSVAVVRRFFRRKKR